MIALLWETGIRIGAIISIDKEDVHLKDGSIDLTHRPDEGTILENGQGGERPIASTDGLSELLEEYVEKNRLDSVDDNGQNSLISSRFRRLRRGSTRRIIHRTTAAWLQGEPCPRCTENLGKGGV